ncbi:unnamed protein product, partial [Hapterophycus canaliculatus]
IVEEVTQEINRVLDLFREHTRNWSGKVSIVAHSLGAIICFDIMANQPGSGEFPRPNGEGTGTLAPPAARVPGNPADVGANKKGSVGADTGGATGREGGRGRVERPEGVRGGPGTRGGDAAEGGEGCMRYYRGSTEVPALSARVENVFCLGSPIGMFLMIRGQ